MEVILEDILEFSFSFREYTGIQCYMCQKVYIPYQNYESTWQWSNHVVQTLILVCLVPQIVFLALLGAAFAVPLAPQTRKAATLLRSNQEHNDDGSFNVS
jgi:hypothetical protein